MSLDRDPDYIKRNDKGYPLLENGEIDWAKTSEEKGEMLKKHESKIRGTDDYLYINKKKRGKHGSNYTPPKKRHRK